MKNQFSFSAVIFFWGLACFWLTGPISAQAQATVSGRVLDGATQQGVSYATVVLRAPAVAGVEGRVIQSGLADENGQFALQGVKAGTYQLGVLLLGYTPLQQPFQLAAGTPTVAVGTLTLQPTSQALQEVTVVAQRPLVEVKPDRITMNVDKSVLAAGNDALSILSMAPSVQVQGGRPTLRGKANVLILLNGQRLPGSNLETVLSSIPGDQIERIELITNPSAKYDADASGGVIEIYTKRSRELGWTGSLGGNVSQGVRTAEGLTGSLRLGSPKVDVAVSASINNRDGFERGRETRQLYAGLQPVGSLRQDNDFLTTLRDASLNASLNYRLSEQHAVGAEVQVTNARLLGLGNIEALIQRGPDSTLSTSANNADLRLRLTNYTLFYKNTLDKLGSNLLLTGSYAQYVSNQQQTFDQRLRSADSVQVTTVAFRNVAPATYGIFTGAADYLRVWSPALRGEAGMKYTATTNDSQQRFEALTPAGWQAQPATPFSNLGYQERIGAGYLNVNYTTGKLALQAGLRAENTHYSVVGGIDSSYFNLFPNLRADYKMSGHYTTSLAYARNLNRPGYENLIPYELFINNYTSRKGNSRLQPEFAHSFSWNNLYKDHGLQFTYTQTTNAIATVYHYDPSTLRFVLTPENFRERHLANLSLTAPLHPVKWWTMNNSASLLYQALTLADPSQEQSYFVKNKVYYTLSVDNVFSIGKNWTVQLNAMYNSPSFSGMLDYGAYTNVRAGVKHTFLANRATLRLDVADLLYTANTRVSSDLVPIVTTSLIRSDTRRVKLSFTYKFGKTDLKSKRVQPKGNGDELNRLGM